MKVRWIITLLFLAAFLLVGCQSAQPTTQPEAVVVTPAPVQEMPVGETAAAYPGPSQNGAVAEVPASIYPGPADGDTISWDQAIGLLRNNELVKVVQGQNLEVKLTLRDGRTLVTTQPAQDEIVELVQSCGDLCKEIEVTNQ